MGTPILIPETYVEDLGLRLSLYRRLGDLDTDEAIDAFAAEMIDRFGPLPEEVQHLVKVAVIKAYCRRANVEKVDSGPRGIVMTFREGKFANPAASSATSANRARWQRSGPTRRSSSSATGRRPTTG